MKPPSAKLQQIQALRLKRYNERGPGAPKKPGRAMTLPELRKHLTEPALADFKPKFIAPVQASAPPQETTMKKAKKKPAKSAAKKRGRSEAAANLKAAKKAAPKTTKPKAAKTTVPALEVAAFMAREGGASMAELVAEFGIEAHPMRAKIHYIRNQIPGWEVETKEGRYYATAPKAAE